MVTSEALRRGSLWWAELPPPRGSEPGYRRPVTVVQADAFNASRIQTVIVAVLTTNLTRASAPGNVLLPAQATGLARDSVVNVSQLLTLDRSFLAEHIGDLPPRIQRRIDDGLRTVLDL
jgi:mRNA interferase MazF